MAIPVIQSVGTAATGTGSSITTNAPSGVASGDLLVMAVTVSTDTSITTPSGWTQIENLSDGSSNTRSGMYYRQADGTSTDHPTVTLGASKNYVAVILRITGQIAQPLGVHNTGSNTSSSTPAVPSVTTTNADELLIALIAISIAPSNFLSNPTNWTTQSAAGTASNGMRVYSQNAATATSYGGETATLITAASTTQITAAFKSAGDSTVNLDVSENLAATDTPTRSSTALKTITENLGVKEGSFYKPKYKTFSPEKLGMSQAFTRLCTYLRQLSENLAGTDTMTFRLANANRQLSENLAGTDVFTRVANALKTVSENMAMTDVFARACQNYRTASDSMGFQDVPLRSANILRALSDTIAMTDSLTRACINLRQISDNLAMTDTLANIFGGVGSLWTIAISDTMALQNVINRQCTYLRAVADSFALTDQFSAKTIQFNRQLAESLALRDTATRALLAMRSIAESLGFTDAATLSYTISTLKMAAILNERLRMPDVTSQSLAQPDVVNQHMLLE